MIPVSIPIPAAVQAEFSALITQALAKIRPYQVPLTTTEQRSLAAATMGPGSLAFAEEASQLLVNYPQVLRRSITDADIARYPVTLATFGTAADLAVQVEAVSAVLRGIQLVAGANVMATARPAYQDAQNDKGKTPGLHALVERLKMRFAQGPDDPTPPTPPTPPDSQ